MTRSRARRKPGPFADRLLAWYDAHARDLPWRGGTDSWGSWVSEVMLQQTRVEAVVPAFERFMRRFPTPASFAAADDDELLEAWRGLGYYRRARLLREGARQVVARHGGRVPSDADDLGALAGVGEYTQGAIRSIAFGAPEPAIDGNVERVFARHVGIRDDVKRSATRRRIRAIVMEHMDRARPGDFNQALMDLGATVCTPRSPRCAGCPIAADCEARAHSIQEELPLLRSRRAAVPVRARAVLVRDDDGGVLGARIGPGEINEGQIELPGPGVLVDHPEEGSALAQALGRRYGTRFRIGPPVAVVRHGITHHRITLTVHGAALEGVPRGGLRFWPADDPAVPWSTPSRKALSARARRAPG